MRLRESSGTENISLSTSLTPAKQVYIDFDGIMENSTVYINGTELGHHPYGYMGVRYDMTKSVVFGGGG
jgi:beta-galactosidase